MTTVSVSLCSVSEATGWNERSVLLRRFPLAMAGGTESFAKAERRCRPTEQQNTAPCLLRWIVGCSLRPKLNSKHSNWHSPFLLWLSTGTYWYCIRPKRCTSYVSHNWQLLNIFPEIPSKCIYLVFLPLSYLFDSKIVSVNREYIRLRRLSRIALCWLNLCEWMWLWGQSWSPNDRCVLSMAASHTVNDEITDIEKIVYVQRIFYTFSSHCASIPSGVLVTLKLVDVEE